MGYEKGGRGRGKPMGRGASNGRGRGKCVNRGGKNSNGEQEGGACDSSSCVQCDSCAASVGCRDGVVAAVSVESGGGLACPIDSQQQLLLHSVPSDVSSEQQNEDCSSANVCTSVQLPPSSDTSSAQLDVRCDSPLLQATTSFQSQSSSAPPSPACRLHSLHLEQCQVRVLIWLYICRALSHNY